MIENPKSLFPGLMICIIVAFAARFLADHYNAPTMLFALLLGLSLHHLSEDDKTLPGITFAASDLLKCGVALLGLRLTFNDIGSLGLRTVLLVICGVVLTMCVGIILSYALGRRIRFGILTGGAVGICGASAALAIASILPKSETRERDLAFTVVAVTTLSTVAMIAYPILGDSLGFDDHTMGILLGVTIHDVAQVVGAGFSVSEQSGNTATLIKLFRVTLLVPIIIGLAFFLRSEKRATGTSVFPLFIVGFAVAIVVNSLGLLPDIAISVLSTLSTWLLVVGIVSIGIKTSLKSLREVGGKAMIIVTLETLFLLTMASLVLVFT